jgi:ribose 5-phosphate isomerase A
LPVPVEVTPFGWEATARHIQNLGAKTARRMTAAGEAFVTDGGGLILDCASGTITDPAAADRALREIVGVVETGLFIGMAETVLVAEPGGVRALRR